MRDPIPDHRDIYESVAAGDPFAAHAVMKHLVDMALKDTISSGT